MLRSHQTSGKCFLLFNLFCEITDRDTSRSEFRVTRARWLELKRRLDTKFPQTRGDVTILPKTLTSVYKENISNMRGWRFYHTSNVTWKKLSAFVCECTNLTPWSGLSDSPFIYTTRRKSTEGLFQEKENIAINKFGDINARENNINW